MIRLGLVLILLGFIDILAFNPPASIQGLWTGIVLSEDKAFLGNLWVPFLLIGSLLFLLGAYNWAKTMLNPTKRRELQEKKTKKKWEKNAKVRRSIALEYAGQYPREIEFWLEECVRFEQEVINADDDARIWIHISGQTAYIDDEKGSEAVLEVVVKSTIRSWEYIDSKDLLEYCCPRIEGEYGIDEKIRYQRILEMRYINEKERINIIRSAVNNHNRSFPKYRLRSVGTFGDSYTRDSKER